MELNPEETKENFTKYEAFKNHIITDISSLEREMHEKIKMSMKIPLFDACYIDVSDPKNRKVRAKKALTRGDFILSAKPLATVLERKEWKRRCHWCFKKSLTLKECSNCHFALYCNSDCQRSDWLDHKLLCKFLKASPHPPPKFLQLISLLYWKSHSKDADIKYQIDQMICCKSYAYYNSSFIIKRRSD